MVDGQLLVDHLLQVLADVAEAQMQPLQGLQLGCDAGGEGADGDVADVAEEVLDADLFGFFGFDDGGGVHEGFGGRRAVLRFHGLMLALVFLWEERSEERGERTSLISSTAKYASVGTPTSFGCTSMMTSNGLGV